MSRAIVIRVPQTPLPPALTESDEYQDLRASARDAFLAHVRYIQEIPFKFREWLEDGATASELEDLVHRVDLDISINLRVPGSDEAVSPWIVRRSWMVSARPIASFLESRHRPLLDASVPVIGAPLSEVRQWIAGMATGLSELLDGFFSAKTFDHVVAHLVATYVLLAGIKFGLGRIGLQFPR
jgi:hypothetical protein